MSARLVLPADADVRVHVERARMPFIVTIARPPRCSTLRQMCEPNTMAACLAHSDRDWPDATGEAIAAMVLDRGGVVALGFEGLAEALSCRARLERERAA